MLLSVLGCEEQELSLLLTDDEEIAELNSLHRGKAKPTDVLSFPMNVQDNGVPLLLPSTLLGDVVISVDTARRQAEELEMSLEEELLRLLIHGVLHLLGYDHENVSDEEAECMAAKEEELWKLVINN